MTHVATLVARDELTSEIRVAAEAALAEIGARAQPAWLAEGEALDLAFEGSDPAAVASALRTALGGQAVDLAVQTHEGRRKKLLLADMESTVIRNEMLDELADFAGKRSLVADVTARAMRGEIDFEGALRDRVAVLEGQPATILGRAAERIVIDPGVRTLVRTLRRHGAVTALVSGGFGVFVGPIAEKLGFDHWFANELEVADGVLTGGLGAPILDRDAKLDILNRLRGELGLELAATAAVGDGANDLPMLLAAGLGVAFHGKPAVAEQAAFRVDHGDLATLLYFMGYRRDELVSGE